MFRRISSRPLPVPCNDFLNSECRRGAECGFQHNFILRELARNIYNESNSDFRAIPRLSQESTRVRSHQRRRDDSMAGSTATSSHLDTVDPSGEATSTLHQSIEESPPLVSEDDCILCDVCGRRALHPSDSEQNCRHREACVNREDIRQLIRNAICESKELTCGVCLEEVLQKENPRRAMFGILNTCSHIFCHHCIHTWHKRTDSDGFRMPVTCPMCRQSYNKLIRTKIFAANGPLKDEIFRQDYKKRCAGEKEYNSNALNREFFELVFSYPRKE